MVKCRSYSQRICFKLIVTNALGIILATIIWSVFSFMPDRKDIWWWNFILVVVFLIIFIIVTCIIITRFYKSRVYDINYNYKWLRRKDIVFCYESYTVKRTITHRLFGLVTIELKSSHGKIILKDVPEKIENYIRGKC